MGAIKTDERVYFGSSQHHKDGMLDRLDFDGLVQFSRDRLEWDALDAFCELTNVEDTSGLWKPFRLTEDWADLQRTFSRGVAERVKATQMLHQLFISVQEGEMSPEHAVQEANYEAKDFGLVVRGFGYTESSPPPDVMREVEVMDTHIPVALIAKYFGWAERVVSGAKKYSKSESGRLDNYRTGHLSQNTTSRDLLALADGDLDAVSRSVDGALTNIEKVSPQSLGLGNVILLRDESLSMRKPTCSRYIRHQHVVALEASLAIELAKKKRKMITYTWSTGHINPRFVWGEGKAALHLSQFQSGNGTRLQPAMELALADALPKSDIVVVTDGVLGHQQVNVPEGTRVWVITIGEEGNKHYPWACQHIRFEDACQVEGVMSEILNRE